jgi:two-component system NtrC family sensor kinase
MMFRASYKFLKRLFARSGIPNSFNFRSTIYGRVVFIIAGSLIMLFVLFNLVFRSIYMDLFNRTIRQHGQNISAIVEGALYYSMLENKEAMLQRTLDVISTMSGIDEVNMYNDSDQLAYTSLGVGMEVRGNPNCLSCHSGLSDMFSESEHAYRVVEHMPGCGLSQGKKGSRNLLIREPIFNEPSCYSGSCHAHEESDEILGSLLINMPLEDLDSFAKESFLDFLLLATLITAILVTFLILFTRNRIKNPLNSLIMASEAVSSGDKSIRVQIKPEMLEDMRMVSEAFNNMLDNIDTATKELQNWSQQLEYKVQKKSEELAAAQNELIHVERIASLGKLSSSVAHEINNPLSGILVYNKLIYKQLNRDDFYHPKKEAILKNLKLIETETKRCGDIVKGLLDFSKKEQEDFVPCRLHQVLKETYNLMTHSIKIADIKFTTDFRAGSDRVNCSPNQIKQALVALLVNASEAIQEHGEIMIRTTNPDRDHIQVEIIDNGSGIAPHDLSHIFEPFFSTKSGSTGIGLGLSIVHGIVESHQGRIDVESEVGQGTTMYVIFPLKKP